MNAIMERWIQSCRRELLDRERSHTPSPWLGECTAQADRGGTFLLVNAEP